MRKFGLEVEFGGSMPAAITAMNRAGLSSATREHSYVGNSMTDWVVKRDGSVYSGGELVSPPLDFDDPAQRGQVHTAINALRDSGARTAEEAGIHVHVDASDLTPAQIAAVVRCYTKFEDVIYRIATSGWREIRSGASSYARPMPIDRVNKIAKAKTLEQLGAAWYGCSSGEVAYQARQHGHQSRYYGINLHSYFYRKTIEFRVFNSSLNPERVQAYIAMCVALVEDARRGKSRSVTKRYALGGMATGLTPEKNAFHRFQQVLRYDAGMDLEDMKRLTRVWKDSVPQHEFARAY